jgi:2-methylcitrate dehydratase PrpD
VHQAKFSMGTVLALIAHDRGATLEGFEDALARPEIAAFARRVRMELDAEVDAEYPARWIGKVEVGTLDGRTLTARVDEPKGDPGNTLSRAEIEDKARTLARFGGLAPETIDRLFPCLWGISNVNRVGPTLPLR